MVVCATCGVEHVEPAGTCAICADERQWVPADGQAWTSLRELREAGHRVQIRRARAQPARADGRADRRDRPAGAPGLDPARQRALGRTAVHRPPRGRSSARTRPCARDHRQPSRICSACRAPGATRWNRRRSWSANHCWTGCSARTRRSRGWRGRHEIAPGLVLHELGGHFSRLIRPALGRRRRRSRRAASAPTRSTATPTGTPSPSCAVTRTASRCRRRSSSGSLQGVSDLQFERIYDNFGRGPKR